VQIISGFDDPKSSALKKPPRRMYSPVAHLMTLPARFALEFLALTITDLSHKFDGSNSHHVLANSLEAGQ